MPDANHSFVIRTVAPNSVGTFGRVVSAIEGAGGRIDDISVVTSGDTTMVRDYTLKADDPKAVIAAIETLDGVTTDPQGRSLSEREGGLLDMRSRSALTSRDDLSMAYTPGVARVCMAIHDDFDQAWDYTIKGNSVMVVSDGSAVGDLGAIGAEAALPACEMRALVMRELANIDAFPLPINAASVEEIANTIVLCSSVFAAVYLHDIEPSRMQGIVKELTSRLEIPVVTEAQAETAGNGNAIAAYPGILRGLLNCRATAMTDTLVDAAKNAVIDTDPRDAELIDAVAIAVTATAVNEGLNRI